MKENIVALVTPFTSSNEINIKKLYELLDYHINAKTDGILLLGTTGESPTLRKEEKELLVKNAISYLNGRIPIWVGIACNNLNSVKEELDIFEKYDFDKYLVITPFYNKCNDEGMYEYFKVISKMTKKDIVIYDIFSRTNNEMSIECLKKLINIKNIVGIKECSSNIKRIIEICKLNSDSFKVYSGDDTQINLYASLNVFNIVSVASNVISDIISNILSEYYNKGVMKGSSLFYQYIDKIDSLFVDINPIGIKTLMNHLGYNVGSLRLPLTKMDVKKEEVLINAWK